MKLFTIVKMELKFISAQGLTSILILLYPFILMFIVGPIFTSIGAKGVQIAVYSPLDDPFPQLDDQSVHFVSSKEDMIAEVLSGRVVLGLSVERDGEGHKRIYTYFEPTKEIVANAIALQLQGKLADVSAELVETNLVSIYNNMRTLSVDIDAKLVKIPQLKQSFQDSKARMSSLESSIESNQIVATGNSLMQMENDAVQMRQSIAQSRNKLGSWEVAINELSNFDSKLQYYDSRLASTDSQLATLQNNLANWDVKLAARITQLNNIYSQISYYLTIVQQVKAASSGTALAQLTEVENGLINARNEVASARNELTSMRTELYNMQNQIVIARNDIADAQRDIRATRASLSFSQTNARNDLSATRTSLDDADQKIANAISNIGQSRTNLESFTSLASSMENYLAQSRDEIDKSSADLDGTEALLRAAKQNIDRFIANDPQKFVPPKLEALKEKRQLRPIDTIFPALIGLVSMLSCLLLPPIMTVKQRAQGVRMRMKLSYASTSSIVLGRFIGDYLVGLAQVLVVALLGSLVFGINLGSNFAAVVLSLLLAPAIFTAMGTLLASFINNEASAVLSSLLVSMPLLFLSGIVLPLEQIHGSVRFFASLLPLYNVIEMISKVTIRDSAIYSIGNFFIVGIYLFVLLIGAYIVWAVRED